MVIIKRVLIIESNSVVSAPTRSVVESCDAWNVLANLMKWTGSGETSGCVAVILTIKKLKYA